MMPLTMAKAGETVTIKKITGKDEVRLHLAETGLVSNKDKQRRMICNENSERR